MSKINYAQGFEDSPLELMTRVTGRGKVNITRASISNIKYRVFEYATQSEAERDSNGAEVGIEATLTVNDVVFDSLQTGGSWDIEVDPDGYNFLCELPGSRRPSGLKWHRVEFWFTPVTGSAFPAIWLVETLPVAGS